MLHVRRHARLALTVALAIVTLSVDALFSQQVPRGNQRRITVINGREAIDGEVIVRYREGMGRIERERAEFDIDGQRGSDGFTTQQSGELYRCCSDEKWTCEV
jgi:hypothetical protein